MKIRSTEKTRKTKETDIALAVNLSAESPISIDTKLPFFNHLLEAMAFHGGFSLTIKASGDIEVDPHHLVEDTGLVLGKAFLDLFTMETSLQRYGHSIIPMDDALSEVIVDISGRPYLYFNCEFPQPYAGNFDLALIKEFLQAFAHQARVNIHCICRHGSNSHHMVEALFKAFGKALNQASSLDGQKKSRSTKGKIDSIN